MKKTVLASALAVLLAGVAFFLGQHWASDKAGNNPKWEYALLKVDDTQTNKRYRSIAWQTGGTRRLSGEIVDERAVLYEDGVSLMLDMPIKKLESLELSIVKEKDKTVTLFSLLDAIGMEGWELVQQQQSSKGDRNSYERSYSSTWIFRRHVVREASTEQGKAKS